MYKSQRQHSFNFGRVFFPGETHPIPKEILLQPLGNHVGNTVRLVKKWQKKDFIGNSNLSFERVLEAAKIHDMGKPQKFEIKAETKAGKFQKYIYSFKGHRFLAKSNKDKWAQELAIGHHDFSVEDICSKAYELKKIPQYQKILSQEPLAYARELYILEMCDQIEAELACRVFEDGDQAESRTFMDFTIAPDELDDSVYFIDPWAFEQAEPIELTFHSWVMQTHEIDKEGELQKCIEEGREEALGKTLDRIVKKWWQVHEGKPQYSITKKIKLKPYISELKSKIWNAKDFYLELGGFTPNPMQTEMFETIYDDNADKHPAILLKSFTGSGKFESILFPSLASNYRLILPLPAKSLLEDQKERVEKYLKNFSLLYKNREVSLVEDTGSKMYRWIYKNGELVKNKRTSNPKRHLYKGDVILTTIDKFLYRYFGFGDKQKSFTFPLRIYQEKTLIAFDEAHNYDEISFTNFHSLVKSLYEAGRSIVLMTATMPKECQEKFEFLDTIDYINNANKSELLKEFQLKTLNQQHPYKSFEWINNISRDSEYPELFQHDFSQRIINQLQTNTNIKLLAVVERVTDAVEIYKHVQNYLGEITDDWGCFLFLYHGRIADQLRPELYKQIKERDTNNLPYIIITTSAIEVGCDLNAEVLISEICPPENLIQRAGRCNRKGNIINAKIIIIGDSIADFANSLDESGWQKYQTTLQLLQSTRIFDVEKISECISVSDQVDDYRVIELFSMLHDYVYGADLTCKHAYEKGLIITRSWTPSATLIYKDVRKDAHTVTVPLDRLIKNDDNDFSNVFVLESVYNPETTRWNLERELGWGCAYSKNIIIQIHCNNEGVVFYDGKIEYQYDEKLGFVKLPGVFIRLKTNTFDEKLLCKHDDKKSAIITYTKAMQNNTD